MYIPQIPSGCQIFECKIKVLGRDMLEMRDPWPLAVEEAVPRLFTEYVSRIFLTIRYDITSGLRSINHLWQAAG